MVLSYSAHSIMYVELAAFIVFVSLSGDRSEYSERLQRGAGWLDGWLDGLMACLLKIFFRVTLLSGVCLLIGVTMNRAKMIGATIHTRFLPGSHERKSTNLRQL